MADRTSTVRVNVVTDASSAGAGIAKFGKVAGAAALGVGAIAVGAIYGADKLYAYADAQDDANASITQGLKTMKLFGSHTDEVTARVISQAEAISKATAVDVTSIKATQAKLLTFKELAKSAGNVNGQFNRATKAAVDLAAKGFGTAETNAVQLGKALNDPVKGLTALNKSGITFTETEKARIKTLVESNQIGEAQTIVLAAIEKQVGGTAEATAGGFELMKNRVSLFAQALAAEALPYLDRFGQFMITTGGPAIAKFANAVGEKALPVLKQLGTFIQVKVLPVLVQLGAFIVEHLVPAYEKVLAGALEGARGLFDNVAKSVSKNGPQLKDMGDKLQRLGVFLVDKVLPVLGDFYKVALPAVGRQIGIAITVISSLYNAWNSINEICKKVADAIGNIIDKLKNVPGDVLSHIPGLRTSAGSSAADQSNQIRVNPSGLTINFNGPVTDPRGTAREIDKLARRYQVSIGGAVA